MSRAIRNQRGQALVETGIVVVILIILLTGIVEFGRAWMIANMITHALRDGARAAAITSAANRSSTGMLNSTAKTQIQTMVMNEIAAVMPTGTLTFQPIDQTPADPIPAGVPPVVKVRITGTIPLIFGLFGASLSVDRSVTFRDEGRNS